jgi:hypothetical protein
MFQQVHIYKPSLGAVFLSVEKTLSIRAARVSSTTLSFLPLWVPFHDSLGFWPEHLVSIFSSNILQSLNTRNSLFSRWWQLLRP